MAKHSILESEQLMEDLADRVAAKLHQRQIAESRQASLAHAAAVKGFVEIAARILKSQ